MPSLLQQGFAACFFLVSAVAVWAEPQPEPNVPDNDTVSVLPLEDLRVFTKAFDHIRNSYIDEIDDRTLLEYAIRGMMEQLDPHSSFLDASTYDDLQVNTTGEFGGLGIEVGTEDGFIKVVSPIDDTPAARGGVEAGDLIIKLDETPVKGLTLDEAVEKMRGKKGTAITLTIVREGEEKPLEITLVRDTIKVRSVRAELEDEHYAYVRIAQFQVNTADDVRAAYAKLADGKNDIRGLVLDLRNNPGGVLQAAVETTDLFLSGGLVVYTEGRLPDSNVRYEANPGDMSNGMPIVVLINDGSASASEIVAGALQDQRRALVIGTRSFGKGSVQSVIPITNDRAVKLTTALYYTPNGRSIQAQGIEPDILVERVRVTAVRPRLSVKEADLSRHLKNTKGGDEVTAKDDVSETELHNQDSQLYEALNILKSLTLFKESQQKHGASQPAPAQLSSSQASAG
ncbi:S41 family peptidase [Teredinibacter turnerae]|uniref:S41 family peptidase n=1 Tax=Teredinibacter turnerae TaxID=2426 RepID=UPI00038057DD|nr:S41 family peptidase [Teredinibacter turnerae]